MPNMQLGVLEQPRELLHHELHWCDLFVQIERQWNADKAEGGRQDPQSRAS